MDGLNSLWRAAGSAALVVAGTSNANAQSNTSSVTLYGVIDAAVEHISNVSGGGSLTRMPSVTGGYVPSRWGIRGREDLGEGNAAVFLLESGFAPDTGSLQQGGRAFGRQAYVGLSSPTWGTLTFGRHWTMIFQSLLESDVMGPALMSMGTLDYYLANARADNSVSWTGQYGAFTAGATYSFGRDTLNIPGHPAATGCAGELSTDSRACRETSVMLKYSTPNWGIAMAADQLRGGPGAQLGLDSSDKTDTRMTLNGFYRWGPVRVGGGVITRRNEGNTIQPRSNLYFAGISYAVTPRFMLDAQLGYLKFRDSPTNDKALTSVVRASYHLSRRTAVYAMVGRTHNSGALAIPVSGGAAGGGPLPGEAQNGMAMGIRHAF
ncbi:TPA: porin [Pseudomonas aeruginosa]